MVRNVNRRLDRDPDRVLPMEADTLLKKNLTQKVKEVRKRWGVARYWKVVPFMQVPIWLSLMEGLRAMCGSNNGLIAYFLSFSASKSAGAEQSLPTVYEPSFAAEGALWFPDLLAGDPTGLLPIMLSTSILLNVGLGWKTPTLRQLSDYPFSQMLQQLFFRVLKSGVQCMAVYVGLSAYMTGMPTGLMIYWITSANVATLQSLFLDKYMFAIKPLKPWMKMHVGVLRPGEVKPPLPSSRE
jgi:inner membrane protein COX18